MVPMPVCVVCEPPTCEGNKHPAQSLVRPPSLPLQKKKENHERVSIIIHSMLYFLEKKCLAQQAATALNMFPPQSLGWVGVQPPLPRPHWLEAALGLWCLLTPPGGGAGVVARLLQSGRQGSLVEQVALHGRGQGQSRYVAEPAMPQGVAHTQAAQVQKGVWLRWGREGSEGK